MRSSWNKSEQQALYGMSLLARVVYLQVLRWRMDFKTGIVGGVGLKLSYAAIAESVDFIPDRGSHEQMWKPTKAKLRAVMRELMRAGLICDVGSSRENGLIIQCLLADTDQSVQNRNDTGTTQERHSRNDTAESNDIERLAAMNDTGATQPSVGMSDTPPVSGIYNSVESNGGINPRARVDDDTQALSPISDDFKVTQQHVDYAAMHRLPDPHLHVLGFINHQQSTGKLSVNWDAEFRKWLVREKGFQTTRSTGRHNNHVTELKQSSHTTYQPEPISQSDPSIAFAAINAIKGRKPH